MAQSISGFKAHPAREEFRDYAIEVPPGTWIGRLDHLAWGNSHNLLCYFTAEATGDKFVSARSGPCSGAGDMRRSC